MRKLMLSVAVAGLAAFSGCVTQGAVGSVYRLDPNASRECKAHCETLDMDMGAVVIIDSSTGCVCHPRATPAVGQGGAAAIAGGAVFAMQRAAEQRQASQSR